MIEGVGSIPKIYEDLTKKVFSDYGLEIKFSELNTISSTKVISFTKGATSSLNLKGNKFYNWDLLFSVLEDNARVDEVEEKIIERVKILKSILDLKSRPIGEEFHGSIRVADLARSARFYTWLFGVEPKEWTHRYVTFVRPDTKVNFVLVIADGKELHHDTLYHLGMGVTSKDTVLEFYHSAVENEFQIEKLPRTTWRGTPLHELWMRDPDGTLIEVYARLTCEELESMPVDKEPLFLIRK